MSSVHAEEAAEMHEDQAESRKEASESLSAAPGLGLWPGAGLALLRQQPPHDVLVTRCA